MILAIFLILLAINFNIAATNTRGTIDSAKSLNNFAVVSQVAAIIIALGSLIVDLVLT